MRRLWLRIVVWFSGQLPRWTTAGTVTFQDPAIEMFDAAIRLDPKDVVAYIGRGDAWQTKGEHDKAIGDFTESIRLNANNALTYDYRAHSWVAKGKHDKAIADFTAIIRLDPRAPGRMGTADIRWRRRASMTRRSPTSPRPYGSIR